MKIAIDVSGVVGPPSGASRYTEQLLRGLSEIDAANEYLIYAAFWKDYPEKISRLEIPNAPNFRVWTAHLPQRLVLRLEHYCHWPVRELGLARFNPDVLHGVANTLPRLRRFPSVLTIHHLARMEALPGSWASFYFNDLTDRSILGATQVIAVSEHTRQEVIRRYGLAPDKIHTIWHGEASPAFRNPCDPARLEKMGVAKPYILFVSAINARKNLVRLVQAYAVLRAKSGFRHRLVLAGRREDTYVELEREIKRIGIAEDVAFYQDIGEADLNSLYRGSDLFVYPSLLEGFGIPIIEAMSCGVPVLAARATCLPEIAGDAAMFFDGTDVRDLARQMERILSDEALRQELIRKGLERAKQFDWRETARKTLGIYALAARYRKFDSIGGKS